MAYSKNRAFALRCAIFALVTKFAALFAIAWFILGQDNAPDQNWFVIAAGILIWCVASGWDVYKEWREHFERKNQWETPEGSDG